MQSEIQSPSELIALAKEVLKTFPDERFFVLEGEMGAGKTTFIKIFTEILKCKDEAKSPTFSIINEYARVDGSSIFHFDFYRIKQETEAMDIGVDDYFYSGQYCFVEWAEKIPNLLPENYVQIGIEVLKNKNRKINISEIRE